MLLFCTKSEDDASNGSEGGHYFFFAPTKNGKLKKLTWENQSPDTINVSYENGQGIIKNSNHQLTQEIKEVDFEKQGNQCQFSFGNPPKTNQERIILCIKDNATKISWPLQEFK